MKKLRLIQPYLFVIYPLLWAYLGSNITEAKPSMLIRPFIFLVVFTTIVLLINKLIFKNWDKAAVISSLIIFMLFNYGYYQSFPREIRMAGISINRHTVIISLWLIFFVILSSNVVWKRIRPNVVSSYMSVLGLILLILPLRYIVQFGYSYFRDPLTRWQPTQIQILGSLETSGEYKPDIYYIILDGYARADVLQDIYHYDNSDVLNFLEEHGFYIAGASQSNYTQTALSLASSLNMKYLDFLPQVGGMSRTRLPLQNLIHNSAVRSFLHEVGYRYIALPSSYNMTDIKEADDYIALNKPSLNDLEFLLLDTSIAKAPIELFDLSIPFSGYDHHRSIVLYNFHSLPEIAKQSGPKFVFAHIVAPHPPFVFDNYGNPINRHLAFSLNDGNHYIGTRDEYREGYIEQLVFVNNLLKQTIENILKNSSEPPIIILQADHGPGMLLDHESKENSCLIERTSIFNAYYFPGDQDQHLYSTITPVNTFRLLFDAYFNADLGLLEDKNFYATWTQPYDFINVSQESKLPCSNVRVNN